MYAISFKIYMCYLIYGIYKKFKISLSDRTTLYNIIAFMYMCMICVFILNYIHSFLINNYVSYLSIKKNTYCIYNSVTKFITFGFIYKIKIT